MQVCKALLTDVRSGVPNDALLQRTASTIAGIRVSEEGQEGLNAFSKTTACMGSIGLAGLNESLIP